MGSYMSLEDIEELEHSLCRKENLETLKKYSDCCVNICSISMSYITYPLKRFYNDMKFNIGHEE